MITVSSASLCLIKCLVRTDIDFLVTLPGIREKGNAHTCGDLPPFQFRKINLQKFFLAVLPLFWPPALSL